MENRVTSIYSFMTYQVSGADADVEKVCGNVRTLADWGTCEYKNSLNVYHGDGGVAPLLGRLLESH